MVTESVVKVVKKYLRNLVDQGIAVEQGIIFGSYAKGTTHTRSDIDLLVVSPQFDNQPKRQDINLLWHTAARTDSRIEPIAVGQRQFEEDDSSAVIEIARREGQVVWLSE
jgi:poly(A) polymerase Pap1